MLESDVEVPPVPVRLAPLPWIVGDNAVWVGYGVSDPDSADSGVKRSVQMPISAVDDLFVVNEAAGKNTCFGDSGGPTLMDLGAGLEVIAVTSHGDSSCMEDGYNSRSDVHADRPCLRSSGSHAAPVPNQRRLGCRHRLRGCDKSRVNRA